MIRTPSSSFTRPADTTAYASGDLIANSTTAASVVPLQFNISDMSIKSGCVGYARLFKDDATTTNANFNLHLFTADPGVPTNGDNGALAVASGQYYLGKIACNMTSGAFATSADLIKRFQVLSASSLASLFCFDLTKSATGRTLYGLLEAAAAYTPASGETFEVTLEIGNDGGR